MADLPSATKQRLLEAAIDLFAEHGYEGTSIRAIAARAGANVASLGYHWRSKEALWHAAYEWGGQWFLQQLLGAADLSAPPAQALPAMLDAVFDALRADSRALRIFVWGALQSDTAAVAGALEELQPLRDAWSAYVATHGLHADSDLLAPLVYGQLVWLFVDRAGQRRLFGTDLRDDAFAARAKATLLRVLRASL